MAGLGWYGLQIPEEYGGSGGSFFDAALFLEETARGQAPIGAYGVTLIVVGALNRFGTEEQKRTCSGGSPRAARWRSPCPSPTRAPTWRRSSAGPGATATSGSCPGSKMWCSFAHKASHTLIVCRSGEGSERHDGLSMVFVPRDAEGFEMRPIDTLGGEDTNELHLDDVRVPADALLGTEGGGWLQLMAGLNNERVILAAPGAGARPARVRRHARLREGAKQFGRPVGSFQALQHRLADLATDLVQARLLVRWVARLTDEDPARMLPQEASMAKLAATELAKRCALEAVQMAGGYGYAKEYPMERHLRSAVVTTIYGGTSEIQRNIIAKTLGL